jgi:hypothetical protein
MEAERARLRRSGGEQDSVAGAMDGDERLRRG